MSVSYSTNWMGPVTMDWYIERGLTHKVEHVVESELIRDILRTSPKMNLPDIEIGDTYELEEIHTNYSAGRIDIRDSSKEGYDGWDEYAVPPMKDTSWGKLSDWLWDLETEEVVGYYRLIEMFEQQTRHKIEWWKDED